MTGKRNIQKPHPTLDGNVPKNWKPVAELEKRPKKMPFSDRLYFWLLALGGVALAAAGAGLIWLGIFPRLGGSLIIGGIAMFALATPSMAQRNGYRI